MMQEAVRSLRNGRAKALFFGLTFFLTTALLFSYFHMAEAVSDGKPEVYVNAYQLADLMLLMMRGDAANLMMAFIVIMCAVDLVFCNDFFVRNKAKELGVRLMCGATYTKMAGYLLIQTGILMGIAIPPGMLAGYLILRLMGAALGIVIPLSGFAWMEFIVVMIMIIFWTTALNCSFAYRSGAALLAGGNMNALLKKENPYGIRKTKVMELIRNFLGILAALVPLVLFFFGGGALAVGMVIGCVGLDRVLTHAVAPALTKYNRAHGTKTTCSAVANGFLRRDILFSRLTVYLYLADIVILLSMYLRENTPLEASLVRISYVCICILQALTILFRLAMDLSGRQKEYHILAQIGVPDELPERIIRREMMQYHIFLFALTAVYGGTAIYVLLHGGYLGPGDAVFAAGTMLVPVIVIFVILYRYYMRVVHTES